jgi:TolA protein
MTQQRFSHAIVASALLHGAAIALIIGIAYLAGLRTGQPLEFFELVAGEGDNLSATEAPALGAPDGNPAVTTQPTPAPTTTVIASAPAPAEKAPPDLSKALKTSVTKAENKVAAQAAKEKAAAEKAAKEEAARQAALQAKMSKEDFDKLQKGKTTPAPANQKTNVPKVGVGLAGGVAGGSASNTKGGAGGTALTAAQQSLVAAYTAMLRDRLNKNLLDQSPPGLSDTLVATVSMRMLPSGILSGATIVKRSGNSDFDKAVLDAIRLTRMPEGPPKGFETDTFLWDFKAAEKAGP